MAVDFRFESQEDAHTLLQLHSLSPHSSCLSITPLLPTAQVDAVNTQRTALESRYVEVQDGLAAAEAELEGAEHEVARLQVGGGAGSGWEGERGGDDEASHC